MKNFKIRLTILLPILFVILIAVSMIFYQVGIADSAKQATDDSLSANSSEKATLLKTKWEMQMNSARSFAESIYGRSKTGNSDLLVRMKSIANAYGLEHLVVCDSLGNGVTQDGVDIYTYGRDYFTRALNGEEVITVIGKKDFSALTERLMVFAMPITNGFDVNGVVIMTYSESKLKAMLAEGNFESRAYSYICNSSGDLIVGSDSADCLLGVVGGHNLPYTNLLEMIADGKISDGLDFDQVKESFAQLDSSALTLTVKNYSRHLVYTYMGVNDWFVINVVPTSYIDEQIIKESRPAWIITATVTVTALLLVIFTVKLQERTNKELRQDKQALLIEKDRLTTVYQNSEMTLWEYDFATNSAKLTLSKRSDREVGKVLGDLPESVINSGAIFPESVDDYRQLYVDLRSGKKNCSCVVKVVNNNVKGYAYVEMKYTSIFDENGKPYIALGTSLNVTEEHEREINYQQTQNNFDQIISNCIAAYCVNLAKDKCEYEKCERENAFMQECDGVYSKMVELSLNRKVFASDAPQYERFCSRTRMLAEFAIGTREKSMEFRVKSRMGDYIWVKLTAQLATEPNSNDVKVFLMLHDVNEAKLKQLDLQRLAELDPLSGLYNRNAFITKVNETLKTSVNQIHALLMVDIDGFKRVNDLFGHDSGDKLIVKISENLTSLSRKGDIVGRVGGDEFMLLIKDVPYGDIIERRAELLSKILQFDYPNGLHISSSIGVAMFPTHGLTFEELYKRADTAMYYTKKAGKDSFLFYDAEMDNDKAVISPEAAKQMSSSNENSTLACLDVNELMRENKRIVALQTISDSFRLLAEGSHAIIFSWEVDSDLTYVSDGFEEYELSKFSVQDIFLNRTDESIIYPADRQTFINALNAQKGKNPSRVEVSVRLMLKGGLNKWCRITSVSLANDQGKLTKAVGMIMPIDFEREGIDLQMNAIVNYMSGGVILAEIGEGANAKTLYVSPSLYRSFGRSAEQMKVGMNLLDCVVAEDKDEFVKEIHKGVEEGSVIDYTYRVYKPNSAHEYRHIRAVRIPYAHSDKPVVIAVITDVTKMKNQEMEIRRENEQRKYLLEHDNLTGLYNITKFSQLAQKTIEDSQPSSYVISILDTNNFKVFNDVFGRAKGDEYLRYVGSKLAAWTEKHNGLICRIYADTFAFLLPNKQSVFDDYDQARKDIMENYPLPIRIYVSVGRYVVNDKSLPIDAMIDRALLAQRSINGSYSEEIAYYSDDMRAGILKEQSIVSEMEEALLKGQFQMYLQPQCNNSFKQMTGAEALVRWVKEDGIVPPDEFIPIFERNGFITRLDRYMWEKACQEIAVRQTKGEKLSISVNVSRVDLYNKDIVNILIQMTEKYKVSPSQLRLEITETAFMKDYSQIVGVVNQLKKVGFSVEMDDFGSGYSSLTTLTEVPVDTLKLDMKFLQNADDPKTKKVIDMIIHIARTLNIKVIAEGVETEAQAKLLSGMRCDFFQGYYYARPMPLDKFNDFTKSKTE